MSSVNKNGDISAVIQSAIELAQEVSALALIQKDQVVAKGDLAGVIQSRLAMLEKTSEHLSWLAHSSSASSTPPKPYASRSKHANLVRAYLVDYQETSLLQNTSDPLAITPSIVAQERPAASAVEYNESPKVLIERLSSAVSTLKMWVDAQGREHGADIASKRVNEAAGEAV